MSADEAPAPPDVAEDADDVADEGGEHPKFAPFEMLCLGLAAQAQVALGLFPDPVTKETKKQLPAARQAIDLLGALEEKTKGNLTAQETALLSGLLADLRLAYVRLASS
jgi:hypothetical protein